MNKKRVESKTQAHWEVNETISYRQHQLWYQFGTDLETYKQSA